MTRSLHELGKMVREQSDRAAESQATLSSAKERFVETVEQRHAGGSMIWFRQPRVLVGALVVVTALVLVGVLGGAWGLTGWTGRGDLPLQVALEERPLELVGRWVRSGEETKQLSFSDGTKLSLHPKTDLRVRRTTPSGATIDLGRGRTLAQIEPKKGSTWDFQAGPFNVKVTGTEFDLAWDPDGRILELALHRGSVVLTGPSVDGKRAVHQGEFVRVSLEPPRADESGEAETTEADEPEEVSNEEDVVAREPSVPSEKASGGWRNDLETRSPQEAMSAIEAAGPTMVIGSASAQELWQIARVARLGGRPHLAKDALLALRNKHGTRGQTSYLLGKVHADQLGATSEAIQWFETYLKEAPGGSLAEQALGRIVELHGGTRAGKRAARRYLERYPNGSYAAFCRSQLR